MLSWVTVPESRRTPIATCRYSGRVLGRAVFPPPRPPKSKRISADPWLGWKAAARARGFLQTPGHPLPPNHAVGPAHGRLAQATGGPPALAHSSQSGLADRPRSSTGWERQRAGRMAGGCERRGDAGSPRPEVGTEASGELSAAWGRLRRLAWVPYGVTCLAPLEGAVVMGLRDGLQVVALDGSPPAFAQGFRASCLAALGAPAGSFVAGTREGAALVFLWRRPGELTLRHQTLLPGGALRALAADGDICFSGSEDGAVQWMRVLEDRLEQHDFLQADSPVTCLAMGAERTSVLVGCQNGRVLEVDRQTAEVLPSVGPEGHFGEASRKQIPQNILTPAFEEAPSRPAGSPALGRSPA